MLAKLSLFPSPLLLTLTVDRSNFNGPGEAHRYVNENGYIRRLTERLKVKAWVWVLEFQGASGLGWPHWHVLLDASDLPRRRLDLPLAWHLWRDRWEIGGLDVRRQPFKDAKHAVFYITKYLTKFPKEGFPTWVLEAEHRIRFFQGSRVVGALVSEPRPKVSQESGEASDSEAPPIPGRDAEGLADTKQTRRSMRPLLERAAECGTASNAVLITPDGETGVTLREYLGTIEASASRVVFLSRLGGLRSPVDVVQVEHDWGEEPTVENRPFILSEGSETVRKRFELLREELARNGELLEHAERVARKRAQMLDRNVFAQRQANEDGIPGRNAVGGQP